MIRMDIYFSLPPAWRYLYGSSLCNRICPDFQQYRQYNIINLLLKYPPTINECRLLRLQLAAMYCVLLAVVQQVTVHLVVAHFVFYTLGIRTDKAIFSQSNNSLQRTWQWIEVKLLHRACDYLLGQMSKMHTYLLRWSLEISPQKRTVIDHRSLCTAKL